MLNAIIKDMHLCFYEYITITFKNYGGTCFCVLQRSWCYIKRAGIVKMAGIKRHAKCELKVRQKVDLRSFAADRQCF